MNRKSFLARLVAGLAALCVAPLAWIQHHKKHQEREAWRRGVPSDHGENFEMEMIDQHRKGYTVQRFKFENGMMYLIGEENHPLA